MLQQSEEQFKVAPIISPQKQAILQQEIIATVLGITHQMTHQILTSLIQIIILCSVLIVVPLTSNDVRLALIVPPAVNLVVCVAFDLIRKGKGLQMQQMVTKNVIFGVYNVLWANHLFVIRQHHSAQLGLLIYSCASIATSIGTIAMGSLKQFGGYSVENSLLGWHSTAFMRFFIALPTLLVEMIYYNNMEKVHTNSQGLTIIIYISSFILASWIFGWLSSLKNTASFVLNKISMFCLGQESQSGFNHIVISVILNMGGISIFSAVYYNSRTYSLTPLIAGATLSSIAIFIKNAGLYQSNQARSFARSIVMVLIESAIGLSLCLIYQYSSQKVNPTIFLAINVSLYGLFAVLKQLHRGWSRFGLSINISVFKYSHLLIIQRVLLRVSSGLSVLFILISYLDTVVMHFNSYQSNVVSYMIIPFLAYRSFKRCVSETNSFSLHVSILICLVAINQTAIIEGCLALLAMPPFPHNPYLALVSIFTIPPKARHKNQACYQFLYGVLTCFGLMVHALTLGIFELTMIFGLPIYFPILSNETQGYEVKSAQNSLYQKIIQNIDQSLFRCFESGFYLIRIEKYIVLMEIRENNYGFGELIDYKGLQVQEVTSCHSKEGETIDKLVEETWGTNKKCCSIGPYSLAISPLLKSSITTNIENDIQLTGVIESKQFVVLFKEAALKAIIRQYSKIQLTQNQKRQGEVINSEVSAFYKKQPAQKLFPFEFAKSNHLPASYSSHNGKVKLPPLSKKGNKKQVHNDFLDLLQGSQEQFEQTGNTLHEKQGSIVSQHKKQQKLQELNMSIVLTLYYYSVGKLDYINSEKLYKIIKKESQAISQIQFDGYLNILSPALASAFKVSIDKYISADFTIANQDFEQYQADSFLGTTDSQQFNRAIQQDKPDIWTLHYAKKSLLIKRMAKVETSMYIFKASDVVLKSVWNNLRFELVYATNDNDERYSIQTHPSLLRNLWVEACQQPFGYPGYHRGSCLNK